MAQEGDIHIQRQYTFNALCYCPFFFIFLFSRIGW